MDIAQLILKTMDDSQVEKPGVLGQAMVAFAKTSTLPDEEDDVDDELKQKINELREYEKNKDLAWLDFASWNSLDTPVHVAFSQHLEPLFWSGLYFSYSKFMENVEVLLERRDPGTMSSIQRDGKNYRFFCLSARASIYDYFGMVQLDKIRNWYEETKYKSIGKTSTGKLIMKTYREGQWE